MSSPWCCMGRMQLNILREHKVHASSGKLIAMGVVTGAGTECLPWMFLTVRKKKKTSKILPVTLTKKTFCGAKVSGFWTTNGNCLNALIIQQCLEEGSFRKGFQRKVLSNHNYRSVSKLCSEGIQAMGNWAVSEFPWCPLLFFVTSSHGFWSVF